MFVLGKQSDSKSNIARELLDLGNQLRTFGDMHSKAMDQVDKGQVKIMKLLNQLGILLPALREIIALVDDCATDYQSAMTLGLIQAKAEIAIEEATAIEPWAGEEK